MNATPDNLTRPIGNQTGTATPGPRHLGRALIATLYALLVGSALLTFWGWKPAPWVFLAFGIVFAFYRLRLVQAGKYPAFKALLQIGLTLLVGLLLMPGARGAFRGEESLQSALRDSDPRIRAMAAELTRYRPEGPSLAPLLVQDLTDDNARVRDEAHASLVKLTGADLGPPEDPKAIEAWKQRYP